MNKFLAFLLCLVFALTGCGVADREEVIDLLASPKLSPEESRVVSAVTDYIGWDILLKYPKAGENIRPIQITTLGTSDEENRIVFYQAPSRSSNVRMSVLKRAEEGWQVIYDGGGLGTEIYKVEFADLSPEEGTRVVVAYTFRDRSEKLLSLYYCGDDTVEVVRTMACQNFLTLDITGDGYSDLVTAGVNADNQRARIRVFSAVDPGGELSQKGSYEINVANAFVTNLAVSETDFAPRTAVAVDYRDPYYRVYTLGIYFDRGDMKVALPPETVQKIWPYSYDLVSRDVDGDGYIDTPTVIDSEMSADENLKFMEWTCFMSREPQRKYYGAGDANLGVFVPLPDEWQDYVSISYDEVSGARRVKYTADDSTLLTFRSLALGEKIEEGPDSLVVTRGTVKLAFTFNSSVTQEQRDYIEAGVILLEQEV